MNRVTLPALVVLLTLATPIWAANLTESKEKHPLLSKNIDLDAGSKLMIEQHLKRSSLNELDVQFRCKKNKSKVICRSTAITDIPTKQK